MAITISGSGITSANIADGTIVNADVADVAASKLTGALPAIDGSALTGVSQTTSVVNTAGQNWAGVAYIDPDAIGASPTAKIYPDGSIVGSTANGNYVKYPNGRLECHMSHYYGNITTAEGFRDATFTYPVTFTAIPTELSTAHTGNTAEYLHYNLHTEAVGSIVMRARTIIDSIGATVYKLTAYGNWK
jgi:hypothetical protein